MSTNPFENFGLQDRGVAVNDATRSFMARVYQWMAIGLFTTGIIAMATARSEAGTAFVAKFFLPIIIVQLVLVLAFGAIAERAGPMAAGAMFFAYSALTGLMLSGIFHVYPLGTISSAFFVTAGSFVSLSLWATFTKKDLSPWGGFLFMGLIGVVIASVVNMFMKSSMMDFVLSCATVVVFAGLTAYDTQKLRAMHAGLDSRATATLSIRGALMLYLDFLNLFLAILRLMGRRRD